MVAVLAIVAILAATVTPSVLRQIERAAIAKERTDLEAMHEALEASIRRTHAIPGHTNWAEVLGEETQLGAAAVASTPRHWSRAFLVDPALRLATAGLPYAQTTNGTHQPISARVMILASIAGHLPVASSLPSADTFNEIWDTPAGSTPASWGSYSGHGDDLLIRRINLRPLFHRLVLINNDLPGRGQFSIDGSTAMVVPTTGLGWDTYYGDGTVIGLHGADGALQCREILTGDASYVFEYGFWRAQIFEGRFRSSRGAQFAAAVQQFSNQPWNPGARFGGTQQTVVDQMYIFLFVYSMWSGDTPCFTRSGSGNLVQVPQYQMLLNAQTLLDQVSTDLTQ
jgi:type II secretory pathway pseudopilin PulG